MSNHGFFIACVLQRGGLNNLDPISIRVFDEGQRLHAAIGQAFLEIHTQRFEARARRLYVGHADADVPEAARIGIAVVVDRAILQINRAAEDAAGYAK